MSSDLVRSRAPIGPFTQPESITEADRLAPHLDDAAHVPGGYAAALVEPRSERDVSEVVRRATRVLAIGAQSSLTGGATPRGETLLSTGRLKAIADLADGRVRVGAGVTLAEIDAHLARRGALYPPLPTWHGATIGGAIATNAAGAATFKYGTTRAWVDELTVVLASGDVLDLRRGEAMADRHGTFHVQLGDRLVTVPIPRYRMPDVPKVSAGYYARPGMDLIDLFIGAEGTLGITTEATLRVRTPRPATCMAFLTLTERKVALELVARLRTGAMQSWASPGGGLDVSAIEHMDARSLAILREDGVDRRLGVRIDSSAVMGLLVALDLPGAAAADEAFKSFAALLQEFDVPDALVAAPEDRASLERLLVLREAVPLGVNQRIGRARREIDGRIEKTAADIIVPFERFDEMLTLVDTELQARGLDGAVWGHISDGNVHPNILPRSVAEMEAGREAVLSFGRTAIRLGGSPLAEHGVGRNETKQRLLKEMYGEDGIEQMRNVKRVLDPDFKLAPGVIFEPGQTFNRNGSRQQDT